MEHPASQPNAEAIDPGTPLSAAAPKRIGRRALQLSLVCIATSLAAAESKVIEPDLGALAEGKGWRIVNRSVTSIAKGGEPAIRFDEKAGIGLAMLENLTFGDGVIEFDVRGKDIPPRRFLGVAFHGTDDRTYDAVSFLPFNFKATEPVRRQRAVQYISHPAHTWNSLREQFPESTKELCLPCPIRTIGFASASSLLGRRSRCSSKARPTACLVVEQLSNRKRGWVALWVDVSKGDFANLKIRPAPSDSARK